MMDNDRDFEVQLFSNTILAILDMLDYNDAFSFVGERLY